MSDENIIHGLIDIVGATCTSCSFAVEHMGEKLAGVSDIWVDKQNNCIHVDYDGNEETLEKICSFVHQIGYQANVSKTGKAS